MAFDSPISPTHEYTLSDYTITAVGDNGVFELQQAGLPSGVEDFSYEGKPESKAVGGGGPNPRRHTRTIYKPTAEITLATDIAGSFEKFVGENGVVDLIFMRQAPGGKPVTDVMRTWKPLFGGNSVKSGDATNVKVTGNGFKVDKDVQGIIL